MCLRVKMYNALLGSVIRDEACDDDEQYVEDDPAPDDDILNGLTRFDSDADQVQ